MELRSTRTKRKKNPSLALALLALLGGAAVAFLLARDGPAEPGQPLQPDVAVGSTTTAPTAKDDMGGTYDEITAAMARQGLTFAPRPEDNEGPDVFGSYEGRVLDGYLPGTPVQDPDGTFVRNPKHDAAVEVRAYSTKAAQNSVTAQVLSHSIYGYAQDTLVYRWGRFIIRLEPTSSPAGIAAFAKAIDSLPGADKLQDNR